MFQEHVFRYRKAANRKEVAKGKSWLAQEAYTLGLVDEITHSDEYLARIMQR